VRRASGRPSSLAPQARDKAFQSALIGRGIVVRREPFAWVDAHFAFAPPPPTG
jgi:hypothetical protein